MSAELKKPERSPEEFITDPYLKMIVAIAEETWQKLLRQGWAHRTPANSFRTDEGNNSQNNEVSKS